VIATDALRGPSGSDLLFANFGICCLRPPVLFPTGFNRTGDMLLWIGAKVYCLGRVVDCVPIFLDLDSSFGVGGVIPYLDGNLIRR